MSHLNSVEHFLSLGLDSNSNSIVSHLSAPPNHEITRARYQTDIIAAIDSAHNHWLTYCKKQKDNIRYPNHAQNVLVIVRENVLKDRNICIYDVQGLVSYGFRVEDCAYLSRKLDEALWGPAAVVPPPFPHLPQIQSTQSISSLANDNNNNRLSQISQLSQLSATSSMTSKSINNDTNNSNNLVAVGSGVAATRFYQCSNAIFAASRGSSLIIAILEGSEQQWSVKLGKTEIVNSLEMHGLEARHYNITFMVNEAVSFYQDESHSANVDIFDISKVNHRKFFIGFASLSIRNWWLTYYVVATSSQPRYGVSYNPRKRKRGQTGPSAAGGLQEVRDELVALERIISSLIQKVDKLMWK